MKEHGILFKAPLIKAILKGEKTQTRRAIADEWWRCLDPDDEEDRENAVVQAPHGPVGRLLWARETFGLRAHHDTTDWHRGSIKGWTEAEPWLVDYRADWHDERVPEDAYWRPSLLMPRWASRIVLEVTRVRLERLTTIAEEDCIAEGIAFDGTYFRGGAHPIKGVPKSFPSARQAYRDLWDDINGRGSFDANPWVHVYDFKVLTTNGMLPASMGL